MGGEQTLAVPVASGQAIISAVLRPIISNYSGDFSLSQILEFPRHYRRVDDSIGVAPYASAKLRTATMAMDHDLCLV